MRKAEELNHPRSCLNKAQWDEMLFVLLERDLSAADTIRFWAGNRVGKGLNNTDDPKIVEALRCADEIEESHRTGKTFDQ